MREALRQDAESERERYLPRDSAASAALRDVGMYGLRVRSAIDLPEWPAPPHGDPDVVILEEPPAPATFDGAPYTACITFEDGFHIEVRGVARYSATAGSCIRVAPEPGAKPEDVRLYLTGVMFGAILHQRGILPLHAGCVEIDGTGVAFAGPSGSGKSTLVAALLRRGATFVTDDICAMTQTRPGESRVWRGAARVKLDGAGMAELDDAPAVLEPAGGNRGKYNVAVSPTPIRPASVPLSRLYLLSFGEGEVRLERLSGLEAISALVDETYLIPYVAGMGVTSQVFKKVAAMAGTLTVSRLIRQRGFEHRDAVLDLIERDVRGAHSNDRTHHLEVE